LPTADKVRICQVLDFTRPSELHSLFRIFHKYKATLPEIKPTLEENNNKSSKIFTNLTSKQTLLNLERLPRQQVIIQHMSIMSTGRKHRKLKSSVLS